MLACCCANATEEPMTTAVQQPSDVTAETIESKIQPTINVIPPRSGSTTDDPKPETPTFGSFTVVVPTKAFSTLGLQMDLTEPSTPMVLGIQEGAVQSFNDTFQGSRIQTYDVLMELDEAQDWAAIEKKMTGELPEKMTLRVKRPKKVEVKFQKTGFMGVKLNYSSKSTGVIIESLDSSGLVETWNSQHASDSIGPLDRIIEFDGKAFLGEELVELLKKESEINITVLKY